MAQGADPEAHGDTPRQQGRLSSGGHPMRRSMSHSGRGTVQLVLKELPDHVAAALSGFDLDGDGTVNLSELHLGADAGLKAVSKHNFYRKLFVILFGLWLAQLGSTFGVRALRCAARTAFHHVAYDARAHACAIPLLSAGRFRRRKLLCAAARLASHRPCADVARRACTRAHVQLRRAW